jgi:type II secretory pathway predicted ATPase ExeA
MFAAYWGLSTSPFTNPLQTGWFHEGPVHEEALARLFFLIEQQRGFGLVNGDPGTGKSLTLKFLSDQVRRSQRQVTCLNLAGLDGTELLWQLALQMQLTPSESESRWSLWRRIADHLTGLRLFRTQSVLMFDHLERADSSCFSVLERLISTAGEIGQVTFIAAARSRELPRLAGFLSELPDLRVELNAFTAQETEGYIRDLLEQAGCLREIFSTEAIQRIHVRSRGLPRTISRLCELALIAGMAEDLQIISSELVDSIATGLLAPLTARSDSLAQHEFV